MVVGADLIDLLPAFECILCDLLIAKHYGCDLPIDAFTYLFANFADDFNLIVENKTSRIFN